jgi:hypothetical protein
LCLADWQCQHDDLDDVSVNDSISLDHPPPEPSLAAAHCLVHHFGTPTLLNSWSSRSWDQEFGAGKGIASVMLSGYLASEILNAGQGFWNQMPTVIQNGPVSNGIIIATLRQQIPQSWEP